MELKTKVNIEEGRQDLWIMRAFDLTVDLLFRAYTEAALLEQWMGTSVVEMESRKHGSYRLETRHADKIVFSAHGTIHDYVKDQLLVRTFEMENSAIGAQLEILFFEKTDADTSQLRIHIIYQSAEHRAEQLKLPFAYGLSMAHDILEEMFVKK